MKLDSMAITSDSTYLSGPLIRLFVISAVVYFGTLPARAAYLSKHRPASFGVVIPAGAGALIDVQMESRSDSGEQAAQQTRPRRVNPVGPAAQPSATPRKQVAPKKPADHPDPPSPKRALKNDRPKAGPAYTIQVGAFLQLENAQKLAQSVGQKGYSARVVTRSDSQGRKWHCVRVGSYSDQDRARKAAAEIESKTKLKPIVRPVSSL